MASKKGVELTLNTIVIAVIVLVVLAVMLLIFSGMIKKPGDALSCATTGLSVDTDLDGVKDAADICPCVKEVPSGCTGPIKDQPAGCPGTSKPCSVTQCDQCKPKTGK